MSIVKLLVPAALGACLACTGSGVHRLTRHLELDTRDRLTATDLRSGAIDGPVHNDYWSLVEKDVLDPLGIVHFPLLRTVEPDGSPGTPIMAWGSYPTLDEAARIAQLFQDEGRYDGRQLIDRERVREALGRSDWPGFTSRYKHSVWQEKATVNGRTLIVPMMSGHGGNQVCMLPSGITAIRFTDANQYDITPLVRVAEKIRPSPGGEARPAG